MNSINSSFNKYDRLNQETEEDKESNSNKTYKLPCLNNWKIKNQFYFLIIVISSFVFLLVFLGSVTYRKILLDISFTANIQLFKNTLEADIKYIQANYLKIYQQTLLGGIICYIIQIPLDLVKIQNILNQNLPEHQTRQILRTMVSLWTQSYEINFISKEDEQIQWNNSLYQIGNYQLLIKYNLTIEYHDQLIIRFKLNNSIGYIGHIQKKINYDILQSSFQQMELYNHQVYLLNLDGQIIITSDHLKETKYIYDSNITQLNFDNWLIIKNYISQNQSVSDYICKNYKDFLCFKNKNNEEIKVEGEFRKELSIISLIVHNENKINFLIEEQMENTHQAFLEIFQNNLLISFSLFVVLLLIQIVIIYKIVKPFQTLISSINQQIKCHTAEQFKQKKTKDFRDVKCSGVIKDLQNSAIDMINKTNFSSQKKSNDCKLFEEIKYPKADYQFNFNELKIDQLKNMNLKIQEYNQESIQKFNNKKLEEYKIANHIDEQIILTNELVTEEKLEMERLVEQMGRNMNEIKQMYLTRQLIRKVLMKVKKY